MRGFTGLRGRHTARLSEARPASLWAARPGSARAFTGLPATMLATMVLVAACASSVATPIPTSTPTPTPTPDPHLAEPASAADVFRGLGAAGLAITGNNAGSGGPAGEPLRRINATFQGWPLIISEFSSTAALAAASGFVPDETPTPDDPPFAIAGLNILVEYGPAPRSAGSPEDRYRDAAQRLADVLDPLLGPLAQSSLVPLDLPLAEPSRVPSGAPSTAPASAPSPSPSS